MPSCFSRSASFACCFALGCEPFDFCAFCNPLYALDSIASLIISWIVHELRKPIVRTAQTIQRHVLFISLRVVVLDELRHLLDVEKNMLVQFVGGSNAGVIVHALGVDQSASVGGVAIAEAFGRGVVENGA